MRLKILSGSRSLLAVTSIALAVLQLGCQNRGETYSGEIPPPNIPVPEVTSDAPSKRTEALIIGDAIEVFVKEDKGFNGVYPLRERGDVIIPRVGRIKLEGQSISQAENTIERALEESQLTNASVIVDRVRRADPKQDGSEYRGPGGDVSVGEEIKIRVYITGKGVVRPGQHQMVVPRGGALGVYDAVLIAGGLSRYADAQRANLVRTDAEGQKHRIPIDLRRIEQGRADDIPIGHGDIVVVPEREFF